MTRALSAFLLFFGLIGLAGAAPASPDDNDNGQSISGLLVQAARAVREENYRGVMVYLREDQIDTLRIIHRFAEDLEQERLISLTGQPREVIRRDGVVTSILPNNKVVLISHHQRKSLLGSVTEFSPRRMLGHYELGDDGQRRLAGRVVQLIRIEPRDKYRYGYRMFIDKKTRLPIRLDLMRNNRVLEQLMFTEITFPKSIPDKAFEPGYDIDGFRVVKHQAVEIEDKSVPEDAWKPSHLPPGFKLAEDGVRRVTENGFVRQMLFTDGVATVSAFIAPAGLRKPLEGVTAMGAVNAYGHVVDDTQITVVGEVPAITVKQIANHIVRDGKRAAAKTHP